jgi:hypothetical protein
MYLNSKTSKKSSNEKVVDTIVLVLTEIFNIYFGHVPIWVTYNYLNFGFHQFRNSKIYLGQQISNEKVMKTKVVELINIYKLYLSYYSIWQSLNNPNCEFQ